jgi:hypothetical protein
MQHLGCLSRSPRIENAHKKMLELVRGVLREYATQVTRRHLMISKRLFWAEWNFINFSRLSSKKYVNLAIFSKTFILRENNRIFMFFVANAEFIKSGTWNIKLVFCLLSLSIIRMLQLVIHCITFSRYNVFVLKADQNIHKLHQISY